MRAGRNTFALSAALSLLLSAAGARAGTSDVVPPRLQDGQDVGVACPEGATLHATAHVVLQLLVDREGHVGSTKPVEVEIEPQGADAAPFVASVEAKARELKFEPARRDGEPIAALIRFAFRVRPEIAGDTSAAPAAAEPPPAAAAPRRRPPPNRRWLPPLRRRLHAPPPAATTPPPVVEPQPSAAAAASAEFGAHANALLGAGKSRASAASDFDLEVGALRAVPRRSAQDYLTLAPGLVLSNHSGDEHAASIFLRGFDAGEGQDLETLVDGMPINEPSNAHGHGYADTQFVIPEVVLNVRVLEGPFDPRQGDFAVAGTAASSSASTNEASAHKSATATSTNDARCCCGRPKVPTAARLQASICDKATASGRTARTRR